MPSLDDMLHATATDVPFQKNIEEVRRNPVLILHSSGSTGIDPDYLYKSELW